MKSKIQLYLIKPSSYDDDGYVVRYFRGVLPSNTLACLASLTRSACEREPLDQFEFTIREIDEAVMKVDTRRICRSSREAERVIVCLVGVQTHQYPRASDLAKEFRQAGLTVLIGGFHVSGQLAMTPGIAPEIQELLDLGVTVVKGEVEETWTELLADAAHGRLAPLYDYAERKPDLGDAPIPLQGGPIMKRFVASKHGTIDCGRGCPFECSFCTIINVQGRKMRFRSPALIAEAIRENYRRKGMTFYFFTDDNFARNQAWNEIFDALIDLREKEQIPVEFMMQVDVLSYKITGFVEKARRAGCTNVFIGMESINDDNLKAAKKRQNHVDDYRNLIDAYRSAEIATHVGYILGFPFDSPESISRDLHRLTHEVRPDMASFFILTPLPGSRDHWEMHRENRYMDPDYNKYDSQHETMNHPYFPEEGSLLAAYRNAWRTFYSYENMSRILRRAPQRNYWNLFGNFFWYKSAAVIEKRHPMMAGLLRLKGRRRVRAGIEPQPRRVYYVNRVRELRRLVAGSFQLLLEMQLLWLETRSKSPTEQRVLEELRQLRSGEAFKSSVAEIQTAYRRARATLPELAVPSRVRLFCRKWNPFSSFSGFYLSQDVLRFWEDCLQTLKKRRFTELPLRTMMSRLLLDFRLTIHFATAWLRRLDA
ncbi:MAG: radical SAM protein [Acidobacteriota bacterium]